MTAVTDFFSKLLGIHLLFWTQSFKFFEVIPLFVAILALLGMNDLASTQGLKDTGQYVILQFVIFVLCFAFCYIWPKFSRDLYRDISVNMICLCLSVAFLSAVFALVAKIILVLPSLQSTFGTGLSDFIYGDLAVFPIAVEDSFAIVLFLIAYACVLANTLIVEGGRSLVHAALSVNIISLIVSAIVAFLASLIVSKPIILSALV